MTERPRIAVITGGGQGIGRAIARDLAARGIAVAIADINPETAKATAAEIEAAGGTAHAAAVDVADPDAVQELAHKVVQRLGGIDILVCNARWAGLRPTCVTEISDEDWQQALDINVTGAFNCVRAMVPAIRDSRDGRIILMSSATVTLPPARPYLHYITTKAALIGMTRALARELGACGVTVNAVLPGSVETGIERAHISSEARAAAAQSQSIPEIIQSDDVTGVVAFLASAESRFITGQSITVDGGRSFL